MGRKTKNHKTEVCKMKMCELFTAYYGKPGTLRKAVYEKPLDWIYEHQDGRPVEIRPAIWLWKSDRASVYFVDYVGDGIGCTLSTFDNLTDAQSYREKIGQMEESEFENWLINDRWAKKDA